MKIAFIGGGSVQWTAGLVTDMALTETLGGATLVLHDIDANALDLLTRACQRIMTQVQGTIKIEATLKRAEALRDADFVILCVSIGGLPAMRNDLEIPARYGIAQSVGDTVGPGGLARGLRHIPFAVQVAREMEKLCPHAWLLNLTNPMTTICRGVTRATAIRTIGLCHEVDIFRRRHLAKILNAPEETVTLDVAGINHLPVILRCCAGNQDGLALLRTWLAQHQPFEYINQHDPDISDIFKDRLAVKLALFQRMGVLFGAGDRHVAEFLPGFLTEANQHGGRYGVLLTTIAHREELFRQRRQRLEQFVAGAAEEWQRSFEQMAPVMAALAGGPVRRFIVNVPNQGQIDNLPREAVVECVAEIDTLGVRPISVGPLPYPAYAAIAPQVARQELVVEAALTGQREPALAALMTDPLVVNPEIAAPLLNDLLAANAHFMGPEFMGTPGV
jgi:alpha-galactosidase/6-phospho-beta-glucosidase family protein